MENLIDDACWLMLGHTSRREKLILRSINHKWRIAVHNASWSLPLEKCMMHGVLQATRLARDVREVQKHLRNYDARNQRLGSTLPEESALLAQSLNNINCACLDVRHAKPYPEGCPFRCCRQVLALKHALNVQRRRDRLSQWLALGATRWRTIEQV